MKVVDVVETSQGQLIPLPDEFRLAAKQVAIRRQGDVLVIEPLKPATWPDGFFASIAIRDPAFARPDQGTMPALHSSP